jgi:hypothetical protein
MKTILFVMLILCAAAQAQEQDACGAIACLAGDGETAECGPYLERFREATDRTEFLNSCPDHGFSNAAIGTLARYGKLCQPKNLIRYLNGESETSGSRRMYRNPDQGKMCAAFYEELTVEKPPRLVKRCVAASGATGAIEDSCAYRWVTGDYKVGNWCIGKESCEEKGV